MHMASEMHQPCQIRSVFGSPGSIGYGAIATMPIGQRTMARILGLRGGSCYSALGPLRKCFVEAMGADALGGRGW